MIFTSGLGILLSLIFGCLFLGLIAELYYLLWWKKQSISLNTSSSDSSTSSSSRRNELEDYIKHAKQHLYLFCWNKPSTHHQTCTVRRESTKTEDPDLESGKDFLFKPAFGGVGEEEEGVESELMRLHNLSGPPRFLFTIKEETKEDLESEDGKYSRSRKGSRTRSLSDLIMAAAESPLILSPLASPPMKAGGGGGSYYNSGGFVECCYSHHGFNPLFESSNVLEAELNRLRCSPPPKFKFLRDAEEKLYRRLLEEAEKMEKVDSFGGGNCQGSEEEEVECRDGSLITIIVGKNREREVQHHNQHHVLHSTSSQVLPLASSPPTSSAPPFESKH